MRPSLKWSDYAFYSEIRKMWNNNDPFVVAELERELHYGEPFIIKPVDYVIDLSNMKIICGCRIEALSFYNCENIKYLDCSNEAITELDLYGLPSLETLNCGGNKIYKLDLSNNKKLRYLYCEGNLLRGLNISENTELEHLNCGINSIFGLKIPNNNKLLSLYCHTNKLVKLDLSCCYRLNELYCSSNPLQILELPQHNCLWVLQCACTLLPELNVSNCHKLIVLFCEGTRLQSLDVSKNKNLEYLNCDVGINHLILNKVLKESKPDCEGIPHSVIFHTGRYEDYGNWRYFEEAYEHGTFWKEHKAWLDATNEKIKLIDEDCFRLIYMKNKMIRARMYKRRPGVTVFYFFLLGIGLDKLAKIVEERDWFRSISVISHNLEIKIDINFHTFALHWWDDIKDYFKTKIKKIWH